MYSKPVEQNPLLTAIVKLFHSNEVSSERLSYLVDESTTEQLIPSFALLNIWLHDQKPTQNTNQRISKQYQIAIFVLKKIVHRVPPVVLQSGVSDLNWDISHPHDLGIYIPFWNRILYIRQLLKSAIRGSLLVKCPSVFKPDYSPEISKIPGIVFESENDISFQTHVISFIRESVVSHHPVDLFSHLLGIRKVSTLITTAFINLISELNYKRNTTHRELLYTFSIVFMYVQYFALQNLLDAQMLCRYLQVQPFLSPFCLLAICCHIPHSLYLYNLLMPPELTVESLKNTYPIVDITEDTTLNKVIEVLPLILQDYFNIKQFTPPADIEINDESDMILMCQFGGTIVFDKMKFIISYAQTHQIPPTVIASCSSKLLCCIVMAVQRMFSQLYQEEMFTPTMIDFYFQIINFLLPTLSGTILPYFENVDEITLRLLFQAIIHYGAYIALKIPNSLSFLVHHISDDGINGILAHILIFKILEAGGHSLTDEIIQIILDCKNDISISVHLLGVLDYGSYVPKAIQYKKLCDFKASLIRSLPCRLDSEELICSIETNIQNLNEFELNKLSTINTLIFEKDMNKFDRLLNDLDFFLSAIVFRVLPDSVIIKEPRKLDIYINRLIVMLKNKETFVSRNALSIGTLKAADQFPVTVADLMLPIAQHSVIVFVKFGLHNAAKALYTEMIPLLIKDKTSITWLNLFAKVTHGLLRDDLKRQVIDTIMQIPYGRENFIPHCPDLIDKITNNLIFHFEEEDPELLRTEFSSRKSLGVCFAKLSILLSNFTEKELVNQLITPIVDLVTPCPNRAHKCKTIGVLTASLTHSISYRMFKKLVKYPINDVEAESLAVFLWEVPYEVYRKIAMNSRELINGKSERIMTFIKTAMNSFVRLDTDTEAATIMLKGVLQSVRYDTPKFIQDAVIDVVGLIYLSLKLYNSRTELIGAATNFPDEQKIIIATSLETKKPGKE